MKKGGWPSLDSNVQHGHRSMLGHPVGQPVALLGTLNLLP